MMILSTFITTGGVHGRIVRVDDLESPATLLVWVLLRTLDSFLWGSYPATCSLLNISGSTRVPAHAWNNAQSVTWGFPQLAELEHHQPLQHWCDIKLNKKKHLWHVWYLSAVLFEMDNHSLKQQLISPQLYNKVLLNLMVIPLLTLVFQLLVLKWIHPGHMSHSLTKTAPKMLHH